LRLSGYVGVSCNIPMSVGSPLAGTGSPASRGQTGSESARVRELAQARSVVTLEEARLLADRSLVEVSQWWLPTRRVLSTCLFLRSPICVVGSPCRLIGAVVVGVCYTVRHTPLCR
jgi:hypothetical protein